jgi:maltose/moltooligosaccharide transporter
MAAPTPFPSSPNPESDPSVSIAPDGSKRWKVGTLTYTAAGLVVLFAWLLWGDFAWNMKERAIQPMSQMLFKQFKASDAFMGFMVTSLPAALVVLFVTTISVRSDNHRGRWGRRIPFLIFVTPVASLTMAAMGYTLELGEMLQKVLGANPPDIIQCRLIVFSTLWTIFEVFTVIANSLFTGLITDVVPKPMIGRFFALFRIVSLGAGIIFNSYIIKYAEDKYKLIFLGLAALYCVGFTLMCLMVKEGDYPPPPPKEKGAFTNRVINPIRTYLKECTKHPFYLWLFLAVMAGNAAFLPINSFDVPYRQSIGMSMERYGDLRSFTYAISIGLAFVIGWLADKFHPIRLGIVSLALYAPMAVWAGFFATNVTIFSVVYVIHGVVSGIFFTGTASLLPRLFPHAKFAQFASAAASILALGSILIPWGVGKILDNTGHDYRYTFLMGGSVAAFGCVVFIVVYQHFLKLGGMKNYTPPS